jgi:molybdenum cofactor biosynthesis protein B
MPAAPHHALDRSAVGCAVVTISDTRTLETDLSGQAIIDLLEVAGHLIHERRLVPDEAACVRDAVRHCLENTAVSVVITTGGTGVTRRDCTYEALRELIDQELPGFGELFRVLSYEEIGAAAMLTRAMAGVVDGRALFVLPGSEHAVRLAVTKLIVPEIGHLVAQLAQ